MLRLFAISLSVRTVGCCVGLSRSTAHPKSPHPYHTVPANFVVNMFRMKACEVTIFLFLLGRISHAFPEDGGSMSLIWPTFRHAVGGDGRSSFPGPGTVKPVVHSLSVLANSSIRSSVVLGRVGQSSLAVLASEDGRAVIVNITNGTMTVLHTVKLEAGAKKIASCPASKIAPSPVLLSNGLAIAVFSGYLVAIDVLSGQQMTPFAVSSQSPVCVSATVNKDGTVMYAIALDGTLAAFAAADIPGHFSEPGPSSIWRVALKAEPSSMPTVGGYDGSVYVALSNAQLITVNHKSGEIMANLSTGYPITTTVVIWVSYITEHQSLSVMFAVSLFYVY